MHTTVLPLYHEVRESPSRSLEYVGLYLAFIIYLKKIAMAGIVERQARAGCRSGENSSNG